MIYFLLFLASLVTSNFTTVSASAMPSQPIRFKHINIKNNSSFTVTVEFKKTDPGFRGSHKLVKNHISLQPDQEKKISTPAKTDGSSPIKISFYDGQTIAPQIIQRTSIAHDQSDYVIQDPLGG